MLYWLCLSEFWCREDTWRLLSHLVFAEHCFSPWCIFTWENYQGMLFRSVHQIGFLYVLPTKFILVCDFWSVALIFGMHIHWIWALSSKVSVLWAWPYVYTVDKVFHKHITVCECVISAPPHLFFKEFLLSSNHKISGCVLGLKVFHS